MKLQRLLSLTRQAIQDYDMIQSDDHIAIGVSGGKDSLALLYALSSLRKFYPVRFSIEAITVDLGFQGFDLDPVRAICDQLDVKYTTVETKISSIVFDVRNESNPCSLCSKLRKGALNNAAINNGCNKIALAHHKDDLIDTMLMSLIFEGRFHTYDPVTYLDRSQLTVIRPLMYVEESDVKGFMNLYKINTVKNPCPVDKKTKREYVNKLTKRLESDNPGAKKCMYHAILENINNTSNI